VQASLRPWCLTGRLGSIYRTGNSLGGIAESEDWTRCSYIWSLGLYGLFNAMKGFLLVYILTNIMNRRSISGNNTEQVLQLQITNLQNNLVAMGTNLAVGPVVLEQLTTGTNNIAIGLGAASSNYGFTTGSGDVMLGINSGLSCVVGSNNTFLGCNTSMYGADYIIGSFALGAGATITGYNQPPMSPSSTYWA